MRCIYCDKKTTVINSRPRTHKTWRRRQCLSCKKVFSTYEYPDTSNLFIVKISKPTTSIKPVRQPFNSIKLLISIARACDHMSTDYEIHAENIVLGVIAEIAHTSQNYEISSLSLTQLVASHIKKLDRVAFIKYCSAHSIAITDI